MFTMVFADVIGFLNPGTLKEMMAMTRCITTASLVLALHGILPCDASAQDTLASDSRHTLGISTGVSNHTVRDDVISPLKYHGTQAPFLLSYECARDVSRLAIEASYDRLDLTSRITDRATSSHMAMNINASVGCTYARRVWSFEGIDMECFLGGSIQGCMNWRTFYYTRMRSEPSFEGMANVGVDAILEARIDKSSADRLAFHVSVPLLSYVLLNDRYNAMVSETLSGLDLHGDILRQVLLAGRLVTLDKLFKVQAEVSYSRSVGRSVILQVQYRFLYYSFAQYEHLWHTRSLTNQALIGVAVLL